MHPRRAFPLVVTILAIAACASTVEPSPTQLPSTSRAGPASPAQPTEPTEPTQPTQPTRPGIGSPSARPPGPTPAPPLDLGQVRLGLEPFIGGLDALTFVTHAGDGSGVLYAVEQRGVVRAIEPGGVLRERLFMDISDRVRAGGEQGLLGLAFHPQFATNRRLFVNYTNGDGDTVVAEFRADADAADAASERVLLRIDQPRGNHNGGMLGFGPDGYLYIGTGDGGGAGDPEGAGQDLGTLLGKLLRIDVDGAEPYQIPGDNPFSQAADAAPEIWAYGLRNPWRFSFDRQTGDLFIGDVGQGAWEEINAEPAGTGGRNYGWNVMEGPDCFAEPGCDTAGLTPPAAAYARADGNCAITGGYVYRGPAFPSLRGAYLSADYCGGSVWGLSAHEAIANGHAALTILAESGISPVSFGEDEAGELYLVGRGGEILRVVAATN